MEKWLHGEVKPEYLATWEGLYTLLDDLQLVQIALCLKKVKDGFSHSHC